VCFSFGARIVGERAKELEKHSLAGDINFVRENNAGFITMTEALLEDLVELMDSITCRTEKPLKKRPDPELLAKVLEAAMNYNIRSLEESIAVLDEYCYQDEPELVSLLIKQSRQSDFIAIQEQLAKIKK
jgi:hypothetical protein